MIIAKGSLDLLKLRLKQGTIFYLRTTEEDGITPKDGDNYRDKYFVIVGIDAEYIYGSAVINTNVCRDPAHAYPLYKRDYPFLDHISYLDCMQLKPIPLSRIADSEIKGDLTDDDRSYIIDIIKKSRYILPALKKRFNIT